MLTASGSPSQRRANSRAMSASKPLTLPGLLIDKTKRREVVSYANDQTPVLYDIDHSRAGGRIEGAR